jgi:hypothetical protein
MTSDHRNRDDFSRFLVHLTRDYDGSKATNNLISILRKKRIEARNAHCLFAPKINDIGFSDVLKRQFNTVCLTEVPLNQLRFLTREIPGRKIDLQPFGLVFWKDYLLGQGANPAIYINCRKPGLRELLLSQFDQHFKEVRLYRRFKKEYGDAADAIIRYYALINIIRKGNDFTWEREWRHKGHLDFGLERVVAIIAPDPDAFRKSIKRQFGQKLRKEIDSIPIISPEWNYEQLVEEMAFLIWEIRS